MEPSRKSDEVAFQDATAAYENFNALQALAVKTFAYIVGIFFGYKSAFTWIVNKLSDSNAKTQNTAKSVDEKAKEVMPYTPLKPPYLSEKFSIMAVSAEVGLKDRDVPIDKNEVVNKVIQTQVSPFYYGLSGLESREVLSKKEAGTFLVRLASIATAEKTIFTLEYVVSPGTIMFERFSVNENGKINSLDRWQKVTGQFDSFEKFLESLSLTLSNGFKN